MDGGVTTECPCYVRNGALHAMSLKPNQDNRTALSHLPNLETGSMKPLATIKTLAASILATTLASLSPAVAAPQTPSVVAASELMTTAAPEMLREVARGYGSSRISKDSLGEPMITGKASGLSYYVFFYDCQQGENCTSVQFQAGFDLGKKVKLELINDWNIKKRFAKAERNAKGNGVLRMDYTFIGGASREHLDNSMDLWMLLLKQFADYIGFKY